MPWSGARLLLLSSLLLSPVVVPAPGVASDMPCERILTEEGRIACYEVLTAQHAKPKAKARPSQPVDATDDTTCTLRVQYATEAPVWWEPAPDISGPGTLAGYRLQRQVNDGRWQDLIDLPKETLAYTDGVKPPLKPGNIYRYRALALWQPTQGEVVASDPGPYAEPHPCFQIVPLAPPGVLRSGVKP